MRLNGEIKIGGVEKKMQNCNYVQTAPRMILRDLVDNLVESSSFEAGVGSGEVASNAVRSVVIFDLLSPVAL